MQPSGEHPQPSPAQPNALVQSPEQGLSIQVLPIHTQGSSQPSVQFPPQGRHPHLSNVSPQDDVRLQSGLSQSHSGTHEQTPSMTAGTLPAGH